MFGSAKKYLGFNDIPLLLVGIPALSLIMPFIFYSKQFANFAEYGVGFGISCAFTSIFWLVNRQIMIIYRRKYQTAADDRKRVIWQFSTMAVVTVSLSFILHWAIIFGPEADKLAKINLVQVFMPSLYITLSVAVLYDAIYYVTRWKQASYEAEKFKKTSLESQLKSLEAQINPHFLFNSLNTLASLVPEDPQKAVEFVHKLSAVYRCILEIKGRPLVTLEEELDCLDNYMFLLETRFGSAIQLKKKLSTTADRHILPLGLQMLVENAVKHNVISTKRPLLIEIEANDVEVRIKNNLQPKIETEPGTKTGLKNIQDRYELLGDERMRVIKSEQEFEVILPLLQVEHYVNSDH